VSFAKSLVGLEEVDIEAERDSCPQSQSSFCQLFLEKKKMEVSAVLLSMKYNHRTHI